LAIAVGMFILVVANLAWQGLPAIWQFGFGSLFSTQISTPHSGIYIQGQVGLLPAILGTLLAAAVALVLALPVSLAMAVFASEFRLAGLGRVMEALLALFAGIPPVIYGLLSIFLAQSFMQPKFAGEGLPLDYITSLPGLPKWNAGMLPREQSTLLGGIFLSLLIIPFMAPLMLDAIRGVPQSLKDASLALGATRWYTLRRVTLPAALSGIIAAVSLGVLKATGDVVISAWAIGIVKDNGMPVPLWDILERNAPLTSTGAALLGGLDAASVNGSFSGSPVPYFAALLLLGVAFAILGVAGLLQQHLHRRFTR
jgi:ABC-type phosphate transport system permease subunit